MAYQLRQESLPLLPSGAGQIRILHFSDLHLTPNRKREIADIKSWAALKPDLVISTGDFLAHRDGVEVALNALNELLDLPGLYVFGSNDYYGPRFKNPLSYLKSDDG
ncbi:MAG: metallophosphoesterase, partial [Candidatus Nanopelagicaceae bacterium]